IEFLLREIVVTEQGIQHRQRYARRGKSAIELDRPEARLLRRLDVLAIALQTILQKIGASEIRESRGEVWRIVREFLKKRNHVDERVWAIVMLQNVVRLFILCVHLGGHAKVLEVQTERQHWNRRQGPQPLSRHAPNRKRDLRLRT